MHGCMDSHQPSAATDEACMDPAIPPRLRPALRADKGPRTLMVDPVHNGGPPSIARRRYVLGRRMFSSCGCVGRTSSRPWAWSHASAPALGDPCCPMQRCCVAPLRDLACRPRLTHTNNGTQHKLNLVPSMRRTAAFLRCLGYVLGRLSARHTDELVRRTNGISCRSLFSAQGLAWLFCSVTNRCAS
ncbi:hypothetical protein JDV02_010831 [Purpureocillium takamizusanense]|uniref:Uncharacterized protein n=1 Tax=Purpureocillium takamizusanense TaxID=2060973 RepID=A0A9Q8V6X0_9HYPO|nr:uncharacterized protein JDV02_010831 [Purpureocillium takamizusanense]UNI14252.1 hypothetical protein JDV02_010831 [Purpureocillium takamizusanense]